MFSLAALTQKGAQLNPGKSKQLHIVYSHVYIYIHLSTDMCQNIKMPVMVELSSFFNYVLYSSHCMLQEQELKTKRDCQSRN